jgi:hypothetical protein
MLKKSDKLSDKTLFDIVKKKTIKNIKIIDSRLIFFINSIAISITSSNIY